MAIENKKTAFLVSVPFSGLGLYGGFRGNRWLRNRIKIFKQFVVPSLLNQTDQDFVIWVQWRPEEITNNHVLELRHYLIDIFGSNRVIFTFTGVPFWDDKHSDEKALEKLKYTLAGCLGSLFDYTSEAEEIHWLLQPSDDLYDKMTVESVKLAFKEKEVQAVTYTQGYICNYNTLELREYNPKTNPPFFAIKFPREIFFDAGKHIGYTGPYKSHEYIGDKLRLAKFEGRGFIVGTHGENISTHFNHPYGGQKIDPGVFARFGITGEPLVLKISIRKWIMRRLPYRWQRKLRYIFGEKFTSKIYEYLRS